MTLINITEHATATKPVQPVDITFEHHPDGLGIGTATPRLSWRVPAGSLSNWLQKSYRVDIKRQSPQAPLHTAASESHHVDSGESVLVPWPSHPLISREIATVRVLVSGDEDDASGTRIASQWSEWKTVEAGLLHASDWRAKFITAPYEPPKDDVPHRPVLYRKEFTVGSGSSSLPGRARLYISALGLYEVYINGRRVGDLEMAPGWTSYHHRLQYQTYDVKGLLRPGRNTIAVEVAEGWYAGRLLWLDGLRNLYGNRPAFVAQLELQDGQGGAIEQQVVSDDSWSCHASPRQSASIYDGEVYDARQAEELSGWAGCGFEGAGSWERASLLDFDFSKVELFSPDAPPVRVTQAIEAVEITRSPSGKTLVDFGQNIAGRVRLQGLQRPAGEVLTMRHAEVLENGELGTRPLRSAKATDQYIFSGNEDADSGWSPHFTFHGFRHVELTGLSSMDNVSKDNLSALVIHSDMRRTGHFTSSNHMLNRLHENVVWSMRGNFLSVPTDCPQRDERMGWTGDIQVFSPTASFIYGCAGFLTNWLKDLTIDQEAAGGTVPVVVPDVLAGHSAEDHNPEAVWDDAAVLVPWTVYNWSGDVEVLRRQWPSMRMHLDTSIKRGADGLWDDSCFQFGDWLDPSAPPDQADAARTDGTMVADSYLVYITGIMAKIAAVISDAERAMRYQADYDRLKGKFGDKYVTRAGLVVGDAETALALVICFDLLVDDDSGEKVAAAGARLARIVNKARFRVSTGFAGTPLILHALARTGQTDLAYRMLLEESCPSWLYPVTMGATTVWERWDSMLPDGSVNPGSMTSFNHYALGSVANFLHAVVGGMSPLEPGWRSFRVSPEPGGGLGHCEVSYESPYGLIVVRWEMAAASRVVMSGKAAGRADFKLSVQVPPNSRALVVLPGGSRGKKEEEDGGGEWLGSGTYERVCSVSVSAC
ncbi:hypothetical protein VSDG_04239 [Cytospora chrysosperma]|uniref:alpha-L-rhamnosidase n=1 Tax=Cytospora chrysosperma TaxID=252740 RepID=A0A423W5I9_CYTCH|nr:hypothetical protein VSDG_04239 [Valsa sordida]